MEIKLVKIFKHIIAWLVLFFIPHIFASIPFHPKLMLYELMIYIAPVFVFYVHADALVPHFFVKRHYIQYFLLLILLFIVFKVGVSFFETFHEKYIDLLRELNYQPKHPRVQNSPQTLQLVAFFMTLAASGMYSYSIQNAKREKKMRELEKRQVESNLQLLKSQLSPHFLFNAMNSLYSMSLKKSEELPKAILTISDLLRYVTYDSAENMVPIQKEIDYIENYLRIQRMRMATESVVDFAVTNNNPTVQIAPMILIPFVENAFKHGKNGNGEVCITSTLKVTELEVDFYIKNTKSAENQKDKVHGIGIQNVKTRLELLYGNKYSLDIVDDENYYEVSLKLQL